MRGRATWSVVGAVVGSMLAGTGVASGPHLSSMAFRHGQPLHKRHTCDGADVSVPLSWDDPPPKTKSFAIIAEDPDAPVGSFVQWVIYDLPASTRALPRAVPARGTLKDGSKQGLNDFHRVGYGGPCPPPGKVHHYYFRLYTLDAMTKLPPRAPIDQVREAIHGHVLSVAEIMGTYQR
jgi:Raf kinase inhibitor-like YbhB/YbcL family protein